MVVVKVFQNAKEAIYWIENIKRKDKRTDLKRMEMCLQYLEHPEKSFKKIHVAGTNGKGSTVLFMSSILQENGYKVGAFISPYVCCFNERIQINNEYICDSELLALSNRVKKLADYIYETKEDIVTFYEILTLIGLLYFKNNHVDYAIIEVGVGGILDATNAINYDLSVITNIGYDHMSVLGNTLDEIAMKKLGILKPGNHLVTGVSKELWPLFNSYCEKNNNSITIVDASQIRSKTANMTSFVFENEEYALSLLGPHQVANCLLAMKTISFLEPNIDTQLIKRAVSKVKFAGRFEKVCQRPEIYIDGAHNINGIESLKNTIKAIACDKKVKILFCALGDKQTKEMLDSLSEVCDEIVITSVMDKRVKDPMMLLEECQIENKKVLDFEDAIKNIQEPGEKIRVITGSLHFISHVRPKFLIN